jgi:catechol 2,3-dioxygenase-like lactoylglutathione lyase family enzyme
MRFRFNYTGIRVSDIDDAVAFFNKVLGIELESRVKALWHKGEFANLTSRGGKHWLDLNRLTESGWTYSECPRRNRQRKDGLESDAKPQRKR